MAQQSPNSWQANPAQQGGEGASSVQGASSVADWMQDVLGRAPEGSAQTGASPAQPPVPQQAVPQQADPQQAAPQQVGADLQSRLAAIARNIETLESRVVGDTAAAAPASLAPSQPAPYVASQAVEVTPQIAPQVTPPVAMPAPNATDGMGNAPGDPLDALRRRKRELEQAGAVSPPAAPQDAQPAQTASAPASQNTVQNTQQDAALDQLTSKLDEQFARLSQAVGDVRQIAEASAADQAGLRETVSHLQTRIDHPLDGDEAPAYSGPSLDDLSNQIRAVQDAISTMPKPDAIQSLEEGYHHVLARLDELKNEGTPDSKIDALYTEVTSLRELLDGLSNSQGQGVDQGQGNTPAVMEEMRGMIARLESDPNAGADRITEALESVKSMALSAGQGADPTFINEAIGAVVERLVALEARIEALASGDDDSPVTERLDAIQSEMARLSTFQDEARGLTSALDTIRDEMRASSPAVDLSDMNARFSALDRIEEMTGGYANQVASMSERLNALDGTLAGHTEMARELTSLSAQMDSFKSTLPVHEIERTLLDLTGRVTALQEDTSAERLGLAVRELGERVESCLKTIPRTETIIQAVEEKIDSRFVGVVEPMLTRLDTVDARLDSIQKAISEDDAPLIEKMSHRLEGLIAAMPTPRADEALEALEKQLAELTERTTQAGMVSRDDVMRLNNELARARASVELGSNRDLQRAIVDQVRHLADRFDTARISGDASLLPEISQQIEGLAGRVQALGLFDAAAAAPRDSHGVDALQDALQSELVSLRESASDQDERMHSTLESVQTALETVIRRINALESDEKAAEKLAEDSASLEEGMPSSLDQVQRALVTEPDIPQPIPTMVAADTPVAEESRSGAPSPENSFGTNGPEAGDAQTLLRQLSGAMDTPETSGGLGALGAFQQAETTPSAPQLPPSARTKRASRRAQNRNSTGSASADATASAQASAEAASQRASFIAAARRAAQAAALQASGGTAPPAPAMRTEAPSVDAVQDRREPSIAEVLAGTATQNAEQAAEADKPAMSPLERVLAGDKPGSDQPTEDDRAPDEPAFGDTAEHAPDAVQAVEPEAPRSPMEELGATAKSAHKQQAEKKQKDEERQRILSRAMLVALVLFTVGIGLFVVNLILPSNNNTVIAPITSTEPAVEDEAAASVTDVPEPDVALGEDVRAVGPQVGSEQVGPESGLEATAGEQEAALAPIDGTSEELAALGEGFERDRGPVMAQTPEAERAAAQSPAAQGPAVQAPPANDLGPLLNLPLPALPVSTAESLPEAIGAPRLRVAAVGGDAAAEFEVATRFMEGRFVPQDLAAAAHWYGRAADQGVVPAAYRLGSFYEQGRGVDRDTQGAIAWYERAALGGNPRAMHNLAVMAAEGSNGGAPDFARAAGWFIPAANRGLADSQFNLAVLFARGMGVERDLMESYKWFALAANAGDSEAIARRDEVAGVLGEQALALATARVDNWVPIAVDSAAITLAGPDGGWDDAPVQAGNGSAPTQQQVAEAQSLLTQRGYDAGPADGLIGPRTSDAVRAFRQSAGLGDSAAIDQTLLNALRSAANL